MVQVGPLPLPLLPHCAGALTAGFNLYRGNYKAQSFGSTEAVKLPRQLTMPVLGIHGAKDAYCLEGQMVASRAAVADGCWHYHQVPNVGHWLPLHAPDVVNKLLLDFIGGNMTAASSNL